MKPAYKSKIYTDRPDYADFDASNKFAAIQSIIAKRLIEHPNAICSYSGGSRLDVFRRFIEKMPETLERDSVTYRNAVRFGLVVPKPRKVRFYFEQEVRNGE